MAYLQFVLGHLPELGYLLLLCLLLFLLYKISVSAWEQWRIHRAFQRVPTDPDQHFIFGHAPRLVKDMGKALDWYRMLSVEKHWKATRLVFGPGKSRFVGLHPDVLRVLLKADPKSDGYKRFIPWLGRGLLVANGSRWARSRRLLTPAFHYDILRPYMRVYGETVNELVSLWKEVPEGQSFNAFPYISLLTLDILLRCSCSHRSNCQLTKDYSAYIKAVHAMSDLIVKRIYNFLHSFDFIYFFTRDHWEFRKNCKIVHDFSMNIIKQRRKELQESKEKRGAAPRKQKYLDFIDILLEAKDEAGVGMTDLEIRAEVDTFVFEGHDTTASGIIWILYNLARHPHHQLICRKEADDIFDQKDFIETEDLKSLQYLKYCIKESMRLFPPVCSVGRILAQDTDVGGGFSMPKGTPVDANIYTVHHHPDFWENPEDFDPLRFTPERSKGRHTHAFVPFSAGPRNCIGQEFALNEERVVIATILRHFELSLDDTKEVEKEFLIILRPKGGLHLKLKHRHH